MPLLKSVDQTAVYTMPLQKFRGIQSFRHFSLTYWSSLISLILKYFLYESWCKMSSPYLSHISGLLGRTDSYILIFFAYPGNCYCFPGKISSLSPDEDISLLLCINEIPSSCIPVTANPYTMSVISMSYLFSSHFGIWWQIVVGVMGLCDSTEKDSNNTWNSKEKQS